MYVWLWPCSTLTEAMGKKELELFGESNGANAARGGSDRIGAATQFETSRAHQRTRSSIISCMVPLNTVYFGGSAPSPVPWTMLEVRPAGVRNRVAARVIILSSS
jgi:hypothetical protein